MQQLSICVNIHFCFILTILGTNSLNSANVQLSNQQINKPYDVTMHIMFILFAQNQYMGK